MKQPKIKVIYMLGDQTEYVWWCSKLPDYDYKIVGMCGINGMIMGTTGWIEVDTNQIMMFNDYVQAD